MTSSAVFGRLSSVVIVLPTSRCGLFQVVAELLRARWVAQFAQGLGFDLADALAGYPKALAHLFQRSLVAVDQAEAQLQHAPFARRQGVEHVLDLGVQHRQGRRVLWRDRLAVLDEVAQVGVLFLANR